jgi:predicted ArsR family transcriptional regulator
VKDQLNDPSAGPSDFSSFSRIQRAKASGVRHSPNSQQQKPTHRHFELTDRGGDMLSKEYLDTAQTLRRVARNMVDRTIVNRLEALAEGYERRAEKASLADSADALARPIPRSEHERSTPE